MKYKGKIFVKQNILAVYVYIYNIIIMIIVISDLFLQLTGLNKYLYTICMYWHYNSFCRQQLHRKLTKIIPKNCLATDFAIINNYPKYLESLSPYLSSIECQNQVR